MITLQCICNGQLKEQRRCVELVKDYLYARPCGHLFNDAILWQIITVQCMSINLGSPNNGMGLTGTADQIRNAVDVMEQCTELHRAILLSTIPDGLGSVDIEQVLTEIRMIALALLGDF